MEIAKLVLEYVKVLAWPLTALGLVWALRTQIKDAFGRLTRVETPAGTAEFAQDVRDVRDEAEELAHASTIDEPKTSSAAVPAPASPPDAESGSGPGPEAEAEAEGTSRVLPADQNSGQPEHPHSPNALTQWLAEETRRNGPGALQLMLDYLTQARVNSTAAYRVSHDDPFHEAMVAAPASPVGAVITAWTTLEFLCLDLLRERGQQEPERVHTPADRLMQELRRLGLGEGVLDVFRQLRELRNQAVHKPKAVTTYAAQDFVRSCRNVAAAVRQLSQDLSRK
ncbi:hypothetical protein ACFVWY_08800 [Streptomyces sp. NPDC058195]|uniref:hypothetical protein n=1 Tax=Streptomyces sp. NPDC058195 TaxID=3346375 RepID=UPI0036EE1B48